MSKPIKEDIEDAIAIQINNGKVNRKQESQDTAAV